MSLKYIDLVADVDSFKKSRRALFIFSLAWLAVQKISVDFSDLKILGVKFDITQLQISTIFWIAWIYLMFVFYSFLFPAMREYIHTMKPKISDLENRHKEIVANSSTSDSEQIKYEFGKLKDSQHSFIWIDLAPPTVLSIFAATNALTMWF